MAIVPDLGQHHYPAISVVMPTFNDGEYLREAIDSILNQTFRYFEFIIVNDGSTDNSEDIINSYNDNRIRYLKNASNSGNAIARNIGMKAARGKYIAMMDSDDIAKPNRFVMQFEYLEGHPEIGIFGSAIIFFDENSWFTRYYPTDPDYIRCFLFFKNAMAQNSVILRREIVLEHQLYYNPEFENGEDFDFWYRAAMKGVRIANMRNALIYYRQSESQLSHPSNAGTRIESLKSHFRTKLDLFALEFNEEEFMLLHNFIRGRVEVSDEQYKVLKRLLTMVLNASKPNKIFDNAAFRAVIFSHRLRLMKYYYFEKKKFILFFIGVLELMVKTRITSIVLFWNNEGRSRNNEVHFGKPF